MSLLYKTFKLYDHNYIYDSNTNSIIKISEQDYLALTRINENTAQEHDFDILRNYQQRGYCKDIEIKEVKHPAVYSMEHYLNQRLEKITLQVTQKCNMRCGYCVYSGLYKNRSHSNLEMSFETAKKAIDFLIKHSGGITNPYIAFYGGEPLLRFNLIKDCVSYCRKNYSDRNIKYSISTNGTLLTKEIVQFLFDNDFSVLISLDGPKDVQNLERKFVNNKGSFDIIMCNLDMIRKNFPDYIKKISLNSVVSPKYNYEKIIDFFDQDQFRDFTITVSYANSDNLKDKMIFAESFYFIDSYERTKVFLWLLGKIREDNLHRVFKEKIKQEVVKNKINYSPIKMMPEVCSPSGPCIAGTARLFVDVNGFLYPCEKVSEKSDVMRIGDLDNGFDISKATKLTSIGEITADKCKKCWCILHCGMCACFADDNNSLSPTLRLSHCDGLRNNALENMKNLCFLSEQGFYFPPQL